ncbi:MAG: class I SAM-dependent methyltransferase [Parachlamydiaceae bacterium]
MTQISLDTILDLSSQNGFHSIILSNPFKRGKNGVTKVTIRPLLIKKQKIFQASIQKGSQIFHENIKPNTIKERVHDWLMTFREGHFRLIDKDYHLWKKKDGTLTISQKESVKQSSQLSHNRPKNYLLSEGVPYPFFIALKMMDTSGKVLAGRRDKFKQVNRFLEVILDSLKEADLRQKQSLKIVDLGCGKAYLTFALYHYLSRELNTDVTIIGVDLKEEVIAFLNQISKECGYQKLHFEAGKIDSYHLEQTDIVIALHACDLATDHALAKAVEAQAQIILAAPCCQHELLNQVKFTTLSPLLKHGILKERFAALLTDACRASLLDCVGYKTQVLEFTDSESTPKNILIKAIKKPQDQNRMLAKEQYHQLKKTFQVSPSLENLLQPYF